MTNYKPGDVITLEHDDGSRLVREVGEVYTGSALRVRGIQDATWTIPEFEKMGWRVTDHKPKIELPTENGGYLDSEGFVWVLVDETWLFDGEPATGSAVTDAAPFTRLVPEGSEREAAIRDVLLFLEVNYWPTKPSTALEGARKHYGINKKGKKK